MTQPFSSTLRSLDGDRFRGWLALLVAGAVLMAVWAAWVFLFRLPIYVVSESARLEINQAVHPVQAPVAGQVIAVRVVLGQRVAAGDVVVDLESAAQKLQLDEERTRLATLAPQIERIKSELQAQQTGRRESGRGSTTAVEEARSRLAEA